jgi:membrane protease YdiL (CAAX protease family)
MNSVTHNIQSPFEKAALTGQWALNNNWAKATMLASAFFAKCSLNVNLMIPNFPIREFMPHGVAFVLHTGLKIPKDKIVENCESIFSIQEYKLTRTFYVASVEELFFRLFIQRVALPAVAKFIPNKQVSRIFDHPITRVMLTSLFFAISHVSKWDTGVNTQFIGGLIYGASAEMTGGVAIPIIAHTIHNLLFSNLDYQIVEPIQLSKFPPGCLD